MKYLFLFALSLCSCSNEEALNLEIDRLRTEVTSKDKVIYEITDDLLLTQDSLYSAKIHLDLCTNGPGLLLEP